MHVALLLLPHIVVKTVCSGLCNFPLLPSVMFDKYDVLCLLLALQGFGFT